MLGNKRARCCYQKSHIWLASHRFPTPVLYLAHLKVISFVIFFFLFGFSSISCLNVSMPLDNYILVNGYGKIKSHLNYIIQKVLLYCLSKKIILAYNILTYLFHLNKSVSIWPYVNHFK